MVVMMMIMMMTMIIRESVVRTRDVLEKTARSKALLVVKTELSLLCSAWPRRPRLPRPNKRRQLSQQFYQITHVENVTFFLRSFFSNNFRLILRIKNIDALDE